jgi:hypothetical protein
MLILNLCSLYKYLCSAYTFSKDPTKSNKPLRTLKWDIVGKWIRIQENEVEKPFCLINLN